MNSPCPLRVGICTTDNRDHWRKYDLPDPIFGPAITAVLEGFAEFPMEIEIHVLSVTQRSLSSPFRLAQNIFYHSLLVPKIGWLRTGYQGCIRAVHAKAKGLDLDLVHGQGTERDCAMEAVFSGCQNLLTLHGNMRAVAKALRARPFSYHWFHALLEGLVIKKTRVVLCNSTYTENLVRPLNSNVIRMPNAVRKVFYDPMPYSSYQPLRQLRFLVVGLSPYKQPLEILRALRLWRQGAHPSFRCLWIGVLSENNDYSRAFTHELNVARAEGWSEYRSGLSAEKLRDAMDQADVLIHIPTEEAFGLVVVEAMLRGLQIVAGRAGGVNDFENIYPAIWMVDPKKTADWIVALRSVAGRSFSRVPRESWDFMTFHPKTIAHRHFQVYRQVLKMPL
jgi:glycosyltransferase involved in cell wall biosynthesis